jgi:hypothetical protein
MTISLFWHSYDHTWSIGEIAGALAFKVLNLTDGGNDFLRKAISGHL